MRTIYFCEHCGAESPNPEACSTACRFALNGKRHGAAARWMVGALVGCDEETRKQIIHRALGIVEDLVRMCDSAPLSIRDHVMRTAAAGVMARCLTLSPDREADARHIKQVLDVVMIAQGIVVPDRPRSLDALRAH